MQLGFYLLSNAASMLLGILMLAMLIRAVLSFIPAAEDWRFTEAVYYVSELAVAPVRAVIMRFSWAEELPIDISFMIAYVLIVLLRAFLPVGSL